MFDPAIHPSMISCHKSEDAPLVVGSYKIMLNQCFKFKTYPCKHYVEIENSHKLYKMSGYKIYCILRNANVSHPHFDKYEEYHNKINSPEEIEKRKLQTYERQKKYEQSRKECEEKQKIIEQYKASSRLDRLKEKHNIK